MRKRFIAQPDFLAVPIEKIVLPARSRDQLPAILAALQWLWNHAALRGQILALVERAVLGDKKATGRPGLSLWQILVLGSVRMGLNADWDRMEHLANFDALLRQMLEIPAAPLGAPARVFQHQTLRDNVARLDEATLKEINALIAAAGRQVFQLKANAPAPLLAIKVDTYVLETDVHFPTDFNLLYDAGRKCLDLIEKYRDKDD